MFHISMENKRRVDYHLQKGATLPVRYARTGGYYHRRPFAAGTVGVADQKDIEK
jgi:hypothetical protein